MSAHTLPGSTPFLVYRRPAVRYGGGMRIIVTAGPTREYIDDVRFLSNASSGRMGCAVAAAAAAAGHEVTLLAGPGVAGKRGQATFSAGPAALPHRELWTVVREPKAHPQGA